MGKRIGRGFRFVGNKKKSRETATEKKVESIRNRSEIKRIGPDNMCGPRKVLKREEIATNALTIIIEGDVGRAECIHGRSKAIQSGKGKVEQSQHMAKKARIKLPVIVIEFLTQGSSTSEKRKSILAKSSANTIGAEDVVKMEHIKRIRTIDKIGF